MGAKKTQHSGIELRSAKILADNVITIEDLPEEFEQLTTSDTAASTETSNFTGSLMALQRQHIMEVLEQENGNKSSAARILGVERPKLYRMIKQHGIEG